MQPQLEFLQQYRQLSILAMKVASWGHQMLSDVVIKIFQGLCQKDHPKVVSSRDLGSSGLF